MTKIDHIVFDIGKVLIHWDAELIYTDLIPDQHERSRFLQDVCNGPWNLEQDRGRDWKIGEDLLIAEHPDKADLIRAYRARWITSVPYAYQDVVAVVEQLLDSGNDVTLLTNFNQETYLEAEEKYPFLKAPRGVTVSGRVGLLKPDAAIYNTHAAEFDLDPQHTVFIDDSAQNVEGARACGWEAIQFAGLEGADKLKNALGALGVQT